MIAIISEDITIISGQWDVPSGQLHLIRLSQVRDVVTWPKHTSLTVLQSVINQRSPTVTNHKPPLSCLSMIMHRLLGKGEQNTQEGRASLMK